MNKEKPNQDPILPPEVHLEELVSSQLLPGGAEIEIGGNFNPRAVDLSNEGLIMRIIDGEIQLDAKAIEREINSVNEWLKQGIASGDEKVLEVYLRNLVGEDEETVELRNKLIEAFRTHNPQSLQLNALHVDIVTGGIAERNLIREGLRPELARQPFSFRDKNGNLLTSEEDLDIVFSRREGENKGEFKIIIGSKKGIESIGLQQELPQSKFVPDTDKITKDKKTNAIIAPLKSSGDGKIPTATVIEVRLGPIDIVTKLAQEEKARQDRANSNDNTEQLPGSRRNPQQAPYAPPPPNPKSGGWTSSH